MINDLCTDGLFQEPCSAILGQGKKMDKPIKEGMIWLINTIHSTYDQLHERIEADKAVEMKKKDKEKAERNERVRKIRENRCVFTGIMISCCDM